MDLNFPSYTTISDKLGVEKPKKNVTDSKMSTGSLAMPVENLSVKQEPVPTFTKPSNATNVQDSLANIVSTIGTIQQGVDNLKSQEVAQQSIPGDSSPLPSRSSGDNFLDNYLAEGLNPLAEQKALLRNDPELLYKEQLKDQLFNELRDTREDYVRQMEDIEKNLQGKGKSAINHAKNKLRTESSRVLARMSMNYDMANNDFNSAQSRIDARIADLDADRKNRMDVYKTAYEFSRDVMTDEEELLIKQKHDEYMSDKDFARQKEIMALQDSYARSQMDYKASLAASGEQVLGADQSDAALNTIGFIREGIARIKGREATDDMEAYDALYKHAAANPVGEFFRRNIGSKSTGFTQLRTYADSLRSNMLMLGSDPAIRDFFGPQMSERDVDMMMASATNLQTDTLEPEQVLAEVNRIEEFIGKYESAVRAKQSGMQADRNVITAPNGLEYVFID